MYRLEVVKRSILYTYVTGKVRNRPRNCLGYGTSNFELIGGEFEVKAKQINGGMGKLPKAYFLD